MKMFTMHFTDKDLCNLGLPNDIRKDILRAYYAWVKEDKPITEFEYERDITDDEYNDFMEKTKWLNQ